MFRRLHSEHGMVSMNFLSCQFWLDNIGFLGHVILAEGSFVDWQKFFRVVCWEQPELLGRSGYYRRVVKYFSSIVSTLIKLTRRGVTFDEMIAVCVVFKSERISLLGYYHYFPY